LRHENGTDTFFWPGLQRISTFNAADFQVFAELTVVTPT